MLRYRALGPAAIVLLAASLVVAAMILVNAAPENARASHAGGMDAMSIDMDPGSTPANGTLIQGAAGEGIAGSAACLDAIDNAPADGVVNDGCPVLGTVEDCARVNENNLLDADEDLEDTLTVDVTAVGIPAAFPMIAWAYELTYPTDLNITAKDHHLLIGAGPGSATLDASDAVPDADGVFNAAAADTGTPASSKESGLGIIQRLDFTTVPTAATDVFPLMLTPDSAAHVDQNSDAYTPDTLVSASVAINRGCPLPPVDIELVSLSLVSISGPTVPSGTNFNLEVTATAMSNGPNPADIQFDLGLLAPADCLLAPPGNQAEAFANVLTTETRTSTQTWTANCTDPSSHLFTASGSVLVTGLADDSNLANNGPLSDPETLAVTGQADPKVTAVTVDAPTDAATGAPFPVTVSATLHNNGPTTPISVDTTFDLPMPPGCSRTPDNPQVVNDSSLAISASTPVQVGWTVSCVTAGLKTFTGTATVGVDQLHVSDSDLLNNSGQGQDTTDTSLGQADVKVTSVTAVGPASAPVNTNFPVTVSTIVHNNGPFYPVNADVTLTLNLPPGCFTPVTTITFEDASLGPSVAAQLPDITFFVACINHSFHNITATATIAVDDPLAGDPTPGNNSATSAAATTAVIRTADFKAVSVSTASPPSGIINTPFNVTVDATVHNNGPDSGPVDVLLTLNLPADCTAPSNPRTVPVTLPVSAVTAIPTETFSVTCTLQSLHSFDAAAALTTPLHVVDPNTGNNNATSAATITSVLANADLKVSSVSVSGPVTPAVGVPFNVTATTTVHNNGPFGPANADTTATLSLPGDCATGDPNPVTVEDSTLAVSTATPVLVSWSVTCATQSNHSFSAISTISVDQLHVQDPAAGNNTQSSAPTNIPVFAVADGKISSSTVLSPPTFIASNTNVQITVRKVLHNNGPFGPTSFTLTKSAPPVAGCTITAPSSTNHNLAVSVATTVDEIWTVNCAPGSYTFNFSNSLTPNALHVTDPTPGNNSAVTSLTVTVDTDGDGIPDDIENACGSNPNNGLSIPERIDGVYAGADDDLDTQVDEVLPPGAATSDCDRDGYAGTAEVHVYSPSVRGDQDPCGTNNSPPTSPPSPIGWPLDLVGGGIPNSTNFVNVLDITSFIAPVRYFNTDVGTHPGDIRWDLAPGGGIFPLDINIQDLSNLIAVKPPMLGGPRALNGPACPFP